MSAHARRGHVPLARPPLPVALPDRSVVLRVAHALAGQSDAGVAATAVLAELCRAGGWSGGRVWVRDPVATSRLRLSEVHGAGAWPADGPEPGTVDVGGPGLVARAAESGQPGRAQAEAGRQTLAVPLHWAGELEAVLELVGSPGAASRGLAELFTAVTTPLAALYATERARVLARTGTALREVLVRIGEVMHAALAGAAEDRVLLEAACRIAVEQTGLPLAAVALRRNGGQSLHVLTHYGTAADYVSTLELPLDDRDRVGPVALAYRSGVPVVVDDVATDARMAPWREPALAHGLRSALAVPLRADGSVTGVLVVYAATSGYFTSAVHELVERVAGLVSFGVDALQRERRRRATEERLAAVWAHAGVGICLIDETGRLTDLNPMGRALLAVPEGPLNLRLPDVLGPTRPGALDGLLARLLAGSQERFSGEVRLRRADDRWIQARASVSLVQQVGERPLLVGMFEDVTERKAWEDALAEAEQMLRRAFDEAAIGMVLTDTSGRITRANEAFCDLLGRSAEDVPGTTYVALTHPEDRARALRTLSDVTSGRRRSSRDEKRYLRADGAPVWTDVSSTPLRDPDGHVTGLFKQVQDVTARHQAEHELRISEERLRTVIANAHVLLVSWDVQGTCLLLEGPVPGSVRDVSVLGRPLADVIAEVGLPAETVANLQRTLAGESFTNVIHLSDAVLEAHNRPLRDAQGRVVGGTAVLVDVTERHRAEAELRRSEERFRALVANSPDIVALIGADTTLQYASPAATRLLGYDPGDLVGHRVLDWIHPDDLAGVVRRLKDVGVAGTAGKGTQFRARDAHGDWHLLEAVAVDRLDDPAVGGIVVNARDVTDRAWTQSLLTGQTAILELIARGRPLTETLDALTAWVEHLLEGALASVLLVDGEGRRLRTVSAPRLPAPYCDGLGGLPVGPRGGSCGAAVFRGEPVIVTDIASSPHWQRCADLALSHGVRACWAVPLSSRDGIPLGAFAVHWRLARAPKSRELDLLSLADRLASLAVMRDRAEHQLTHAGLHDPLTDLPNRTLLLDRIEHALARAGREQTKVAVLFTDLDRFKNVNDSLGHSAGDRLLLSVASRLSAALRPGDTVARLGGDEFVVLAEGLSDENEAAAIAQRLLAALGEPVSVDEHRLFVSASIGVAVSDSQTTAERLLADADAAMYRAKERGRSRSEMFDAAMQDRARGRLDLQNALHRAVERGELWVAYQPQVRLSDGATVGVEALARWRRSDGTEIPPSEFIPVAEDSGLILPLGGFVLDRACSDAAALARSGHPVVMSVNLSARQLAQPTMPSIVAGSLRRHRLDPSLLRLEVTESVLMDDVELLTDTLDELRELGVQLAIDDFGTGYSSLLYLRRLPVVTVKVDASFVAGLGVSAEDEAIVSGIVHLAHDLGLTVVAEGVESQLGRDRLTAIGCDEGQGFLFAAPMDITELHRWLSR